jgi:SAM-dependent methyltransferase
MSRTDDKLRRLSRTWDSFGREDPLWAVLTEPSKRGRKWDPREFFATGEAEIAEVESMLRGLQLEPRRNLAVDFGCGAGRVTRALASRFDHVVGVDVAGSMIAEARRLNDDVENATFSVNTRPDLPLIESGSVDFFYSRLVFQHMDPELTLGYLAELGRILARGGVAAFQVPRSPVPRSRPVSILRALVRPLRRLPCLAPRMSMFAVPERRIERTLTGAGLTLVAAEEDAGALPLPSYLYVATRPA